MIILMRYSKELKQILLNSGMTTGVIGVLADYKPVMDTTFVMIGIVAGIINIRYLALKYKKVKNDGN